jgi:hypothetical protein
MTVHKLTRVLAIIIIVAAFTLLTLLQFHIVDWGQSS